MRDAFADLGAARGPFLACFPLEAPTLGERVKNSITSQYLRDISALAALPGCCQNVAILLPFCCHFAARLLPVRCHPTARMRPECGPADAKGSGAAPAVQGSRRMSGAHRLAGALPRARFSARIRTDSTTAFSSENTRA